MSITVKQNSFPNKKEGEITRSDKAWVAQQAKSVLKNAKAKAGDVIRVTITGRTSIELPANLTQEEIEARIEKYNRLHKSKI